MMWRHAHVAVRRGGGRVITRIEIDVSETAPADTMALL